MASKLKTEAQAKGDTILKESLPDEYAFLDEKMRPFFKEMTESVIDHAFGQIWSRTILTKRMRSITTVVSLASIGGCEMALRTHLKGALRHGCTVEELKEIFLHLHIYVGYPRAVAATNVLREIVVEMGGGKDLRDFESDPLAFTGDRD